MEEVEEGSSYPGTSLFSEGLCWVRCLAQDERNAIMQNTYNEMINTEDELETKDSRMERRR